ARRRLRADRPRARDAHPIPARRAPNRPHLTGGDAAMSEETVNVRYMVDDVEEAVGFYTTLFGFEVISEALPAFADVRRGALPLLLRRPRSSAGRPKPARTAPR